MPLVKTGDKTAVKSAHWGGLRRRPFAEAAAQGKAVYEIDAAGPATAEIEAITAELMEFAQ